MARSQPWLDPYRYKKGQSGNPGGKRKLPQALREALPESIKVTLEIMSNEAADPGPRLLAAARVQDYNLGKPGAEPFDDSDDVPHERPALVAKALDRIAEWYPAMAEDLARAKQKLPTEGEAQSCVTSDPQP